MSYQAFCNDIDIDFDQVIKVIIECQGKDVELYQKIIGKYPCLKQIILQDPVIIDSNHPLKDDFIDEIISLAEEYWLGSF